MSYRIQAALYRFSNPRKVAFLISSLMLALALTGCGNVATDCPSGGSSGACGGG